MNISIIIPTHNEAENIGNLIKYLWTHGKNNISEIIVSDFDSQDDTTFIAENLNAIVVRSAVKGRAFQMNKGAEISTGDVLYFLHADTYPPPDFIHSISNSIETKSDSGCFRLSFDIDHWFLNFLGKLTSLDMDAFRFGDQSLFIKKLLFESINCFDSRLIIMEDNEIIRRIRKVAKFVVLNSSVKTSARKYLENGKFKLQFIFVLIFFLYKIGFNQSTLIKVYKTFISDKKVITSYASVA